MSATVTVSDHAAHREAAIATLVVAFSGDPVVRWHYPETQPFLTHFPQLIEMMGGAAFQTGTADRIAGDAGAALWIRPGTALDDAALASLLERSIEPDRHELIFAFAERTDEHRPDGPHWYLPFMGIDPRCQGLGYGSALLGHGLARCDRDGRPAYLDATTPRSRVLYERHGFAVLDEVQVGDSPPVWPMLRTPR